MALRMDSSTGRPIVRVDLPFVAGKGAVETPRGRTVQPGEIVGPADLVGPEIPLPGADLGGVQCEAEAFIATPQGVITAGAFDRKRQQMRRRQSKRGFRRVEGPRLGVVADARAYRLAARAEGHDVDGLDAFGVQCRNGRSDERVDMHVRDGQGRAVSEL